MPILDEVEIRLTPLNNEIVEKVKAQGIRVNLAQHNVGVSPALSTSQGKNLSNRFSPCNECNGCLVPKCGECQLCVTTSKKYCIKQNCATLNSSQRLIVNKSPDEATSVKPTELNNQAQVGIEAHLIIDVNDEIERFTDDILQVENNGVVPMETERLTGRVLSSEDTMEGNLSSCLQSEAFAKNVNKVDESQENYVETKSISLGTPNTNVLRPTQESVKVNEGPTMHAGRCNNIHANSTVIFKSQDMNPSDKFQPVTEETTTNKPLKYNSRNETDTTICRYAPLQDIASRSNKEHQDLEVIDVTVEKLDKALLNEISQTGQSTNRLSTTSSSEVGKTLPTPQNPVHDFRSEVRAAEMEIHDIVARTARVSLTSSNLDLSMAKNMLSHLRSNQGHFYVPTIKTEYVQRILLSYFYFVRLKDEESCQQLQGKFKEIGLKGVY